MNKRDEIIEQGMEYLTSLRERKRLLNKSKEDLSVALSDNQDYIKLLTIARDVINQVFIECGMEAKNIVEAIGTLSLQTIYGNRFALGLEDNVRYNKTEFKPKLIVQTNEGEEYRKLRYGGVVDIISFSFRLALWALKNKQSGIFWFDEPFKWVQKDKEQDIENLLKELKKMLKIQMILTTHSPALAEIGDRAFRVTQTNEISKITKIS